MSGEAFSAFRNPGAIGNNGSVPGLIFKLKLWGVPHMGFEAMRIVGWIYTLVVVAGVAWLATARPPERTRAGDLAGHPRARDDAEPVHGDLRLLPGDVARRARRAGRPA